MPPEVVVGDHRTALPHSPPPRGGLQGLRVGQRMPAGAGHVRPREVVVEVDVDRAGKVRLPVRGAPVRRVEAPADVEQHEARILQHREEVLRFDEHAPIVPGLSASGGPVQRPPGARRPR